MIFLKLFIAFFEIGLFGFGGGYGMLSLIQGEVVTHYHWLTPGEFTDIVAISQMTTQEAICGSVHPRDCIVMTDILSVILSVIHRTALPYLTVISIISKKALTGSYGWKLHQDMPSTILKPSPLTGT